MENNRYRIELDTGSNLVFLSVEIININYPNWAVATCSVRLFIEDSQIATFNNLVIKKSNRTGGLYFNAPSKENGVDANGNPQWFPYYNIQGKMIGEFNRIFEEVFGNPAPQVEYQQPQQQPQQYIQQPTQQPTVGTVPPPSIFGNVETRVEDVNATNINLEEIKF